MQYIKIGIVMFVIFVFIYVCTEPSQYEKDYESSRNKTWSEMTPGERKVVRDEIEWRIKEQEKEYKYQQGDW